MKSRDKIFCTLSLLVACQVVVMVAQVHFGGIVKRIDKTTSEHSVVLASHSTKLDAILDFGFNSETTKRMKEKHDRNNP